MTEAFALLCRTTERKPETAEGVRELGEALGARIVGEPGEPRVGQWADDLAASLGCLREAGRLVDESLGAGRRPLLVAGHCAICMTTLPGVAARHPDASFVWLDAHADFNTPETTPSGFLGGMCLSAACGVWDAELEGAPIDPARVHMIGVRDLDPGEERLVDAHRVSWEAPTGGPVFIHLDLDVLDPAEHPADFPAGGGMTFDDLSFVLDEIAESCTIVGAEVTGPAPGLGRAIAGTLAPLL